MKAYNKEIDFQMKRASQSRGGGGASIKSKHCSARTDPGIF